MGACEGDDSPMEQDVPLTGSGGRLDLLFQYMRSRRQTDLSEIIFKRLAELAKTVGKYRVFPAITVTRRTLFYCEIFHDHSQNIFSSETHTKYPPEVVYML